MTPHAHLISSLLLSWQNQRDYAQRLVADLSDQDMVSQPIPGVTMNHPAWTLGHLSPYPPVLAAILKSEPFTDPLNSKYGRGSKPSPNLSDYPPKSQLLADFLQGHDLLARTLEITDPQVMANPIPLARWKDRFPRIGDAVLYLMLSHEGAHLGQISAWRRAGNRPAV
jgi:hypothetical protein